MDSEMLAVRVRYHLVSMCGGASLDEPLVSRECHAVRQLHPPVFDDSRRRRATTSQKETQLRRAKKQAKLEAMYTAGLKYLR